MEPIRNIKSLAVVLPDEHIDTDQIIPAEFLTTTTSVGLGEHAFSGWRRNADGTLRDDCALNDPRAEDAQILVTGRNFGCGSSREHAAWALRDRGVRVVISCEIADIFRNNAQRNGLLPIILPEDQHKALLAKPFQEIEVDLEACEIRQDGEAPITFEVDAFARVCLLDGVDHLGYLVKHQDQIEAFDKAREAATA